MVVALHSMLHMIQPPWGHKHTPKFRTFGVIGLVFPCLCDLKSRPMLLLSKGLEGLVVR